MYIRIYAISAFVLLCGGVNVLEFFGWNLETNSTSLLIQLFPSSFVLISLLFWKIAVGPKRLCVENVKGVQLLVVLGAFLLFLRYMVGFGYFSTYVNCLLLPVLIAVLYPRRDDHFVGKWSLAEFLIYGFYYAECCLAISEKLLSNNVFPFIHEAIDGVSANTDTAFRSSALQNHPIQNALCVSIVMAFILVCGGRFKYFNLLLGYLAILSFNTRSSIFAWAMIFFVGALVLAYRKRNNALLIIKGGLLGCVLLIGVVYLVFNGGWGERLMTLGLMDDSSSQVRVQVWAIFNNQSIGKFLLPIPAVEVSRLMRFSGVEILENYWIIYILNYGLVAVILLIFFYVRFYAELLSTYALFQKFLVACVLLLISSSNNSLAVPSAALALFSLCCIGFKRGDAVC